VLNRNQGPIAEAVARRAEAAAEFNALQAKVLADVDSAMESLRATETSAALLRDLTDAQARSRDALAAQVSAGAATPLDLLSAQLELAEAEAGQLEARVKRQQALAAIEDAVQFPMEMLAPAVIEQSPAPSKERRP
jgi:outer membrane protein TolC